MKKQIIAAAAAAMICVGAIGGTFAYLTSGPATVTNTFTVGNGVNFRDPKLGGGLDEALVNDLGEVQGTTRVQANTYKLIPGHEYTKDPMVHIAADSDECYVFIKVENAIKDIETSGVQGKPTIAQQITSNGWRQIGDSEYYYYNDKITASSSKDLQVFNKFWVDSAKTSKDLEPYRGKTIVIKACAVQADGFTSAADAVVAWPSDFGTDPTTTSTTPTTPAATE